MIRVMDEPAILASYDDNADLDSRIDGFHRRYVIARGYRITVRVMRTLPRIGLPATVAFVTNLPILETMMVGDIGILNPVGGFLRRACAVVGGDDGLRVERARDAGEGIEVRRPRPGVVERRVGAP